MADNSITLQQDLSSRIINWSARLLVTAVWASTLLFGIYIFAFYFIALFQGDSMRWNEVLPDLYSEDKKVATVGIGIHFAAGSIILILGCIQLIEQIRLKFPAFHRWTGRIYVLASLATAIGGLVFIFTQGTIGSTVMDIAFAGYGIFTFIAALATIYFARKKQFDPHRAWAIRLFALAIGSWLYRMDYGFWFLFTDGLGHADNFTGWFDYFMDFFFYIPNLLVAEIFIGQFKFTRNKYVKGVGAFALVIATTFIILASYNFTKHYWGPAILEAVAGN